jgi:FtsP/CotA-like multicopper oxidase with cupredoxin domain
LHRKTILILVMMLIGGALTVAGKVQKVNAATVNFTLYGSAGGTSFQPPYGWGFTSTNITSPGPTMPINQYDNVTLTLTSQDGRSHQFFIDYNDNGVTDSGEPASAVFTSSTIFTFNATVSGTYTYRCSIHPSIMYGTIIVSAVVPEFSLLVMLPFLFLATSVLLVVQRKRRQRWR